MTKTEAIENLKWLRECSYVDEFEAEDNEALDMAIKALEQEPSGDAVSRQAVQDYIAKYLSQYLYNDVREAVEVIDEYIGELPSVKQEPKTGHWISHYDEDEKVGWYECDRCHTERAFNTKFCPDCGARMVEQESEGSYE